MNRETMLKRLEAGYDPIVVAAEKWNDLDKKWVRHDAGNDSNCALCYEYWVVSDEPCDKCPLFKINDGCIKRKDSSYRQSMNEETAKPMLKALYKAKEWQEEQKCKDDEPEEWHIEPEDEIYKKLENVSGYVSVEEDSGTYIISDDSNFKEFDSYECQKIIDIKEENGFAMNIGIKDDKPYVKLWRKIL